MLKAQKSLAGTVAGPLSGRPCSRVDDYQYKRNFNFCQKLLDITFDEPSSTYVANDSLFLWRHSANLHQTFTPSPHPNKIISTHLIQQIRYLGRVIWYVYTHTELNTLVKQEH